MTAGGKAQPKAKQMPTVTAYQQYGFSSPEELDEACSAAYAAMQFQSTGAGRWKDAEQDGAATAGVTCPRPALSGTAET